MGDMLFIMDTDLPLKLAIQSQIVPRKRDTNVIAMVYV